MMRISPDFLECVVFISARDPAGVIMPCATGFVMGVPDETDPKAQIDYVVTASHCITDVQQPELFVRTNTLVTAPFAQVVGERPPGYVDWPTSKDDWFLHDTADVAAIAMPNVRSVSPLHAPYYMALPISVCIARDYRFYPPKHIWRDTDIPQAAPTIGFGVDLGDPLFFLGLFIRSAGMDRNLPLVRFGNVSRMPGDELIPIESKIWAERRIRAYLAECHSWGGHSGSPVFWYRKLDVRREAITEQERVQGIAHPFVRALLGLVSAHFDIRSALTGKDSDARMDIKAEINSGIAVVTPAEAIRELLMRPDVVADRRTRRIAYEQERERECAATPDHAGSAPPTQATREGYVLPVPARKDVLSALGKATRKRKSSRRGKR